MYKSIEFHKNNHYLSDKKTNMVIFLGIVNLCRHTSDFVLILLLLKLHGNCKVLYCFSAQALLLLDSWSAFNFRFVCSCFFWMERDDNSIQSLLPLYSNRDMEKALKLRNSKTVNFLNGEWVSRTIHQMWNT